MRPMRTRLVYKYKNEEKRDMTFEDWIVYIIYQNEHKLPWNKN